MVRGPQFEKRWHRAKQKFNFMNVTWHIFSVHCKYTYLKIFEKHETVISQNSNILFVIRFIKTGAVIRRWLSESLGGIFVQFCT